MAVEGTIGERLDRMKGDEEIGCVVFDVMIMVVGRLLEER